jgi:hypothetical protein
MTDARWQSGVDSARGTQRATRRPRTAAGRIPRAGTLSFVAPGRSSLHHHTPPTSLLPALLAELDQNAASARRLLALVPAGQGDVIPHARSMSLSQLAVHAAERSSWLLDGRFNRGGWRIGPFQRDGIPRPAAFSSARGEARTHDRPPGPGRRCAARARCTTTTAFSPSRIVFRRAPRFTRGGRWSERPSMHQMHTARLAKCPAGRVRMLRLRTAPRGRDYRRNRYANFTKNPSSRRVRSSNPSTRGEASVEP